MTTSANNSQEQVVLDFVSAFEKLDWDQTRSLLDDNIVMYITNAEGGVDKVQGRDILMQRFQTVDYSKAQSLSLIPTQILSIETGKVMVMVHVKAHKNGVDFQNYGAYLGYIKDNKITHLWMVEAQPAYSDQFWKT
ncbi:MAG: hypothetical protein HYX35_02835 [Proteobacteria bacterium]|nr:hypothetical protein [Pseudomonadota bacterium]